MPSLDLLAARIHAINRSPFNRTMKSCWNVCLLAQVLAAVFSICFGSNLAAPRPDSPPEPRTIELGPRIDLSDLGINKQAGSMKLGAPDVSTIRLEFQVDQKSCIIYATPEGYDYLAVGELLPEAQWGHPLLPAKTFKVELDKEAEVLGLEVVEGTFREIKAELNLLPAAGKDFQVVAD